jgi:hypothetical protein
MGSRARCGLYRLRLSLRLAQPGQDLVAWPVGDKPATFKEEKPIDKAEHSRPMR